MSTKSKRATSIGYGQRFKDMLRASTIKRPGPQEYTMASDFTKDQKSRAFTFGMSRDYVQKVYLKENPPVDIRVPGPGQYQVKREVTEYSPAKFTCRPKTAKDKSFQNITKFVPGPGTYSQQASESHNGFIVNSRYKSSAKAVISRGKYRFDNSSMKTSAAIPGPGLYQLKLDLNVKGVYQLARYKNSGAPIFTRGKRDTNLDTSVTRKSKHITMVTLVV